MKFSIESAESRSDLIELGRLHRAVFVDELKLPPDGLLLGTRDSSLHLLARDPYTGEAVGTLSVVETTGDRNASVRYGLPFPSDARTARLARLAVLPRYRGLNAPLQLILKARRSFLLPRNIAYSWLLFDPYHATGSKLCRLLHFTAACQAVPTEYGLRRVMFRDELAPQSDRADSRAIHYIDDWIRQSNAWQRRLAS